MDTSSVLNTYEYLNITLCMSSICAPLYFLLVACWEVTWPNDLQTRFCQDTTGQTTLEDPLEPQVHWDLTGTTLADASTQWCSSGDPVLICIIGKLEHRGRPLEPQVHWDATGTTLADASTQWCSSGDPVLICIIGTLWNTIGRPLEDRWKHTGNPLATNNSFSSGISMYTGV